MATAKKAPAKKAPAKKAPAKKAAAKKAAVKKAAGEEDSGEEGPSEEGAGQEARPQRRVHEGDDAQRRTGGSHRRQAAPAHRSDQEALGVHQEEQASGPGQAHWSTPTPS